MNPYYTLVHDRKCFVCGILIVETVDKQVT